MTQLTPQIHSLRCAMGLFAVFCALSAQAQGEQPMGQPAVDFVRSYHYCYAQPLVPSAKRLDVLTYNIKAGLFTSLEQVMGVLEWMPFDVLGLQEVDYFNPRSGSVDQAGEIAKRFGLCGAFYAALDLGANGKYGIALLSRSPINYAEGLKLPAPIFSAGLEQRVALHLEIPTGDLLGQENGALHAVVTHLSLGSVDRQKEVRAIRRHYSDLLDQPVVLMGDLNSVPRSKVIRELTAPPITGELGFTSAHSILGIEETPTVPSLIPSAQFDHFMMHGPWELQTIEVPMTAASDHRPLWMRAQVNRSLRAPAH